MEFFAYRALEMQQHEEAGKDLCIKLPLLLGWRFHCPVDFSYSTIIIKSSKMEATEH